MWGHVLLGHFLCFSLHFQDVLFGGAGLCGLPGLVHHVICLNIIITLPHINMLVKSWQQVHVGTTSQVVLLAHLPQYVRVLDIVRNRVHYSIVQVTLQLQITLLALQPAVPDLLLVWSQFVQVLPVFFHLFLVPLLLVLRDFLRKFVVLPVMLLHSLLFLPVVTLHPLALLYLIDELAAVKVFAICLSLSFLYFPLFGSLFPLLDSMCNVLILDGISARERTDVHSLHVLLVVHQHIIVLNRQHYYILICLFLYFLRLLIIIGTLIELLLII